jgi:hypothetical protein
MGRSPNLTRTTMSVFQPPEIGCFEQAVTWRGPGSEGSREIPSLQRCLIVVLPLVGARRKFDFVGEYRLGKLSALNQRIDANR